jgi:hypothetical protein
MIHERRRLRRASRRKHCTDLLARLLTCGKHAAVPAAAMRASLLDDLHVSLDIAVNHAG